MNANKQDAGGLLPCPFCGHDDSLYVEHVEGTIRHPAYYVRCDYCGAQNGSTDSGEHVKKWNERAELCRAAPAGGDVNQWFVDALSACGESVPLDAAPAGSGEVPEGLRQIIHELRTYNPIADTYNGAHIHNVWARELEALLRKLQQGADYVMVPREALSTEARRLRYRAAECWPTFSTGTDAGAQMIGTAEALERLASQGQEGGHAEG